MISLHTRKIWLVRHGQSKAQTEEELSIDSGLSRLGTKQAKRLAKALKDVNFDRIYVSPLKRARETFEHSRLRGSEIRFDSRAVEEMPEGAYSQLLPYGNLPDYAEKDKQDAWNLDARSRASSLMNELYASEARQILVVSHFGFLNHLLKVFFSGSENTQSLPKYCHINNTGISVFSIGTDRKQDFVVAWNDIRHVYDLISPDPLSPLTDAHPDPRP